MSVSVLGDGIENEGRWTFGGNTPRNFDSHVARSVPRYADGHELIAELSDHFVTAGTIGYELGCSTGALTLKLAQRHPEAARWIGIDIEPNMIAQARESRLETSLPHANLELVTGNITTWEFVKSDFIVAYYTIQFVRPRYRQALLQRIYESLNWGGAFVMFEKVRGPDARFQDILSSLYVEHKLQQGYGATEIVEKSRSLKGVLEPFSTRANLALLRRAGFVDVATIFKHICFEGFLCIK